MKIVNFIKNHIWKLNLTDLSFWQSFWVKTLRVLLLVVESFKKKQVQQGASVLTYYSLLSIVPILAFLLAIAQVLLIQDFFKQWIGEHLSGQRIVADKLIDFAQNILSNTNQSLIMIPAFIVGLWAGIKMLTLLEFAFNQIWGEQHGRKISKRFSDYLAILFFCPLVLVLSALVTIVGSTALTALGKESGILRAVGPLIFFIINATPFVLTSLVLTLLYIFIPNTDVKFLPAFYAGVITGCTYQLIQWLYVYFQVYLSHYNTIYGTFAALPLFIMWLHISWLVILTGAKLTFAFQNIAAYDVSDVGKPLSHRCLNLLSLKIAHICVRDFYTDCKSITANELSQKLQISLPLTKLLLTRLINAGILVAVVQDNKSIIGYQPAIALEQLTIKKVIDMIENHGEKIKIPFERDLTVINSYFEEFSCIMEKAEHNLLLKDF